MSWAGVCHNRVSWGLDEDRGKYIIGIVANGSMYFPQCLSGSTGMVFEPRFPLAIGRQRVVREVLPRRPQGKYGFVGSFFDAPTSQMCNSVRHEHGKRTNVTYRTARYLARLASSALGIAFQTGSSFSLKTRRANRQAIRPSRRRAMRGTCKTSTPIPRMPIRWRPWLQQVVDELRGYRPGLGRRLAPRSTEPLALTHSQ